MDDAVAGRDVRLDHGGGVVDDDTAADHADRDLFTLNGAGRLAVEADRSGGIDRSCDDVVGQDVAERFAGQQLTGGQAESVECSSECVVGRGEHGEGTFTAQCVDEAGFGNGSDERLERAGADCDVDDCAEFVSSIVFLGHLVGHVAGWLACRGGVRTG